MRSWRQIRSVLKQAGRLRYTRLCKASESWKISSNAEAGDSTVNLNNSGDYIEPTSSEAGDSARTASKSSECKRTQNGQPVSTLTNHFKQRQSPKSTLEMDSFSGLPDPSLSSSVPTTLSARSFGKVPTPTESSGMCNPQVRLGSHRTVINRVNGDTGDLPIYARSELGNTCDPQQNGDNLIRLHLHQPYMGANDSIDWNSSIVPQDATDWKSFPCIGYGLVEFVLL